MSKTYNSLSNNFYVMLVTVLMTLRMLASIPNVWKNEWAFLALSN